MPAPSRGIGAVCWVLLFVGGGYFFGSIPVVRDNLPLIIILIIVASFDVISVGLLSTNREWVRARLHRKAEQP